MFKKVLIIALPLILLTTLLLFVRQQLKNSAPAQLDTADLPAVGFETSAFPDMLISDRYTCNGANVNPPMKIHNTPKKAVSLVLIVDDRDTPVRPFAHWLVWNIDPQTKDLWEDWVPTNSVQGENDFGENGYSGPCPPPGPTHHYRFRVYALDSTLDLPRQTTRVELEAAMVGRVIAYGEFAGLYSR